MSKTPARKQENKNTIPTKSQKEEEKIRQQENEIEELKKENQQQKIENEQLKKENEQLKRENEQLKRENEQQKRDIKQIKEKSQEEIIRLKEENECHKKEPVKNQPENDSETDESKVFKILDKDEIENLEKIEELGSGGGGKVFKVIKKELYALKEMNTKNAKTTEFKQFIKEYEIMSMLEHANILKTYGIFLSDSTNPPSILLEFCPQNLQNFIEDNKYSNKNEELVKIIYQIAEGMKYIHFKKVIHRDLKPTNIMIMSDGTVKICDFGISKLMTIEEQTMTRGVGSQKFMAPEIINEEDYYDEKVDVYSFGVLLFFIMTGGLLPKIRMFDILKGKKAEIPSSFTELSKKLINDCWNFEAKDRPSFKDIIEEMAKNHYNLLQLNKSEVNNIETFVKQHKEKLPKY